MKYFLHFVIFTIGTACFLFSWFLFDKALITFFGDSTVTVIVGFVLGLLAGWTVDAILVSFLPEKYK